MKIVVAPDKFKGSLTGIEFCDAVEKGIHKIVSNTEIIKLPLADGGDGTIEVANYYLQGEIIHINVNNPFFKLVEATYLYAENTKTAFIEMAEASGLKLLKKSELDCKNATTFGTGELIINAIEKGAKNIILGIGGSATNDCGIGMATALGYQFLDKNNNKVKPIGANLSKINKIVADNIHPKLKEVSFKIACDVTNPLYGENGAAYVYAEQKGALLKDIKLLDKGLKDFSKIIKKKFNVNPQKINGAGAAGGMGIACMVFLNGKLISGIKLIKELAKFEEHLNNTDWIITGEGKLDSQTLSGKTIQGVLESALKHRIKTAIFCGSSNLSTDELKAIHINYCDTVISKAKNFDDAMQNSYKYVVEMAVKFSKSMC